MFGKKNAVTILGSERIELILEVLTAVKSQQKVFFVFDKWKGSCHLLPPMVFLIKIFKKLYFFL